MSLYNYFVETKEGLTFHFYTSDIKDVEEELKRKKEFSEGDYWILDAGYNQDIKDAYEIFEEDDSFVKIPKSSVIRFFSVAGKPPKQLKAIKSKNLFNFLKK